MRDSILTTLRPVRQRQWSESIARAAVHGLIIGAMIATILGGLRLSGLWPMPLISGLGVLIGIPAGAAMFVFMRCLLNADWLPTARAVDWHYELKDRTETALAFVQHNTEPASPWAELQLADALRYLEQVEPRTIVPSLWPSSWRWAAATSTLAVTLLFWPTGTGPVSAGSSHPIDAIVTEAEIVETDLRELLEQLPDEHDSEIEQMLNELLAKAEEMKEPGVDLREALAKLSEMQSELQAVAAELNVAGNDEQLKSIGEALQSADALKSAGEALQNSQHKQAADELAKLDNPQLDRKEARTVSDKLKKAADSAKQQGQKKLNEAAKQIADGLDKSDPSQTQQGLSKLSDSARQQANRKQVSDLLKKQSDKLGECKGNCQSNANGNKPGQKPNLQAGKGTNSETQGTRTDLAAKHNEEKIQGQKGEQGEGDVEKIATTSETDEHAKRSLKEVYHKYRKLSDAVLDAEDIPLGHRQTIRRYFEAIRPTSDDAKSNNKSR